MKVGALVHESVYVWGRKEVVGLQEGLRGQKSERKWRMETQPLLELCWSKASKSIVEAQTPLARGTTHWGFVEQMEWLLPALLVRLVAHPFGSCVNSFGNRHCDVDMFIGRAHHKQVGPRPWPTMGLFYLFLSL